MLCVFIAVCGSGGGPLPATNGLLENTDSYASPCGELWGKREKGEDLERRLRESGFWRESGGRHQVDTETEFKVLIRLEAVTNNEICTSRLFWEENKTIHREWKLRSFFAKFVFATLAAYPQRWYSKVILHKMDAVYAVCPRSVGFSKVMWESWTWISQNLSHFTDSWVMIPQFYPVVHWLPDAPATCTDSNDSKHQSFSERLI